MERGHRIYSKNLEYSFPFIAHKNIFLFYKTFIYLHCIQTRLVLDCRDSTNLEKYIKRHAV